MKILIFHQFYTRLNEPGISRFNLFAKHWQKEGVETKVIVGMINYQTGRKKEEYKRKVFIKEKDGEIEIIRVFDSAIGYRTFLGRILSYVSFLFFSFWAGLFSAKPDIIIVSSPPIFLGIVGYLLSISKRVPFVLELRDLWPDEAIELGYVENKFIIQVSYLIEKFLYGLAELIVVNSPGFKEFLIEEKRINTDKIGVVSNPVDFDGTVARKKKEVELFREALGWKNKFVVLYSGSHSFVYDFSPLIETAKKLESNKNILFVLIGDGRQKPALIKKINQEKIKNVRFLDTVPKNKVGYFIEASDVCVALLKKMRLLKYVYASKLFDYMAHQKPIILAMEGVSVDLVCQKAKCGICIEPANAVSFQKAIIEFYNNNSKLKKLGENGYKFAKNNFSSEILAEQYLKLLKPIIIPKRKSD
ncbi:MAG: glycosyltransferase family 4 protein [Patescibacteria group bacterium]